MTSKLLTIGTIITVVGIIFSIIPAISVSNSNSWFNQSFIVPEGGYYYVYGTFQSPNETLHIDFEVTQNNVVDFWVMDYSEFLKFNSSQPYNYYQIPSAPSISGKEAHWTPPSGKLLYFVWDNSQSITPKPVSAQFTVNYNKPLLSPLISVLGLFLLFSGLGVGCLGLRPLTLTQSKGEIIAGYVFAALGGLIGIAIGVKLFAKQDLDDKFHGKIITTLGIVAIITYTLFSFLFLILFP